ncbi:hypothetical protein JCM3770_001648 [Rhodotorula araucariae]
MDSPPSQPHPTPGSRSEAPQPTAPSLPGATRRIVPVRCLQCKERRVKCNRISPRCKSCTDRGLTCVFPGPKAPTPGSLATRKQSQQARAVSSPSASTIIQHPAPVTPAPRQDQVQPAQKEVPTFPPPPRSAHSAPTVVMHNSPIHLPSFPVRFSATSPVAEARQAARDGLVKSLTFGGDAPLGKVTLAGVDCPSLLLELQACDDAYATDAPALAPLLSATLAPSPPAALPASQQIHAHLSTYFARIEPALELFAPAATQAAWQAQCVELWTAGIVPEGKGWLAAYLAGMAMGAMAMTEDEWYESGMSEGRQTKAREWVEEAARLLVADGLRAALVILHYHLLGFGPTPNVLTLVSSARSVLHAAYELGLHIEPSEMAQDKEERRTLWRRVFELETSWAPLVGSKTPLDPLTFSTSLAEPAPSHLALGGRGHPTRSPSALHTVLLVTARLSRLLALPRPPPLLDLFLLASELAALSATVGDVGEEQRKDPLAEMLLHVAGLRVYAALVEADAPLGADEGRAWLGHAETLLASDPLECAQAFHLVAMTLFLHGAVLVALRLRLTPAAVPPATHAALSARLVVLLNLLRTSAWPIVVHLTVQRGIIVLERLVQVSGPGGSAFAVGGSM